ncbi:MAG: terminase large subunit domain-containing protein, partial [Parvibaculum sp.]
MTPETWAAAGLDAPEAVVRHRMLDMRVAAGAVRDGEGIAVRPEGPLDLSQLSPSDLAFLARDWPILARPEQLPPEGDWRSWLILGGRGSGKTRAGAEWVQAQVIAAGKRTDLRIALVAETLGDAREVMIDGASGLSRIARRMRPEVEISRRRLVWPNGAIAQIFSSEDPESLRGPQFHLAWCDELAKWKHADETFDMLQFALRLGDCPRQVVTTTPRPVPLLKRLIADEATRLTKMATAANARHLAPGFLAALSARYGGTRLGRQ